MDDMVRREVFRYVATNMPALGKTKLQKSLYFLQESFKIPLDFDFVMFHYGPYSQEIEKVLTEMSARHILKLTYYPKGSWVGCEIKSLDQTTKYQLTPSYIDKINNLISIFSPLDAETTELCATIHFVRSILDEKKVHLDKNKVINEVSRIKPKFTLAQISTWFDKLISFGLMPTVK